MRKAPLQQMKDAFSEKEKLVEALSGLLTPGKDETKDQLKARLQAASNKKLLRLHAVSQEIKESFGSIDKLVDSLVALLGRAKDLDFRKSLLANTPSKLLDLHRTAARKAKRAASDSAKTRKVARKRSKSKKKK